MSSPSRADAVRPILPMRQRAAVSQQKAPPTDDDERGRPRRKTPRYSERPPKHESPRPIIRAEALVRRRTCRRSMNAVYAFGVCCQLRASRHTCAPPPCQHERRRTVHPLSAANGVLNVRDSAFFSCAACRYRRPGWRENWTQDPACSCESIRSCGVNATRVAHSRPFFAALTRISLLFLTTSD